MADRAPIAIGRRRGCENFRAQPAPAHNGSSRLSAPNVQSNHLPLSIDVRARSHLGSVRGRTTSTPNDGPRGYSRLAAARVFRQSSRGRSSVAGRGGGRLLADERHRGGPPHDIHGAHEPAVRVPAADAVPPPGRLCRGGYTQGPGAHRGLTSPETARVLSTKWSVQSMQLTGSFVVF